MELQQLRYFLEVAASQHMTRSAEKLHIAQPALTRAIHRLEQELGVPLFLPHGRGIVLSEYGAFLQRRLSPILEELDSLPGQLREMAKLESQTIRLNVLAASILVTEAVIAYRQRHENLNFQLTQNAESRLYDIGVSTRPFHRIPENRTGEEFIFTEKIFLAVPASHPLARRKRIRLADAAGEGFISLMGSRQFRWTCDRFCQQAGFSPDIIFESDSPAAVRNMIAARIGVGFWPEYTWGELHGGEVRLLEISDPPCRRDILFDWRPGSPENTAAADFFAFLKNFCAEKAQT